MQNFNSQQGIEMDVHESQFVPKMTSTQILIMQFFFWKICILFLLFLFLWIVSNVI
jgi:hypothetical protein